MAKKKKPETTEHGALTVTENAEDFDLELRWAGKVLGLRYEDVKALRHEVAGMQADSRTATAKIIADIADRIEGVLP